MNVQQRTTVQHGVEIHIPLNKLKKSSRNARRTPHSAADIEALAASIAVKGVLQPPVVEPERDGNGEPTGAYLVTIGEGRRLALRLLAKRKVIAKTEPIRCLVDEAMVGKTGVGKSILLAKLIQQDIAAGRGFALIDPHGDLADKLWCQAPPYVREQLLYLNSPDPEQPLGYNPLRRVREDHVPLAASGALETLRKLWPAAWGVRMEHVLRNCLYALLEREGSTLPDILRFFNDKDFRRGAAREIRNPVVKTFWQVEFEHYPPRLQAEAIAPIQNKLGALLSDPVLHRILVAPAVDLHFRTLMDQGRGLLVNLSRGQLGEDASQVLGGLIVTTSV